MTEGERKEALAKIQQHSEHAVERSIVEKELLNKPNLNWDHFYSNNADNFFKVCASSYPVHLVTAH
jgi:hypothetical protein